MGISGARYDDLSKSVRVRWLKGHKMIPVMRINFRPGIIKLIERRGVRFFQTVLQTLRYLQAWGTRG